MAAKFIPRQAFPHHGSIPRSYYLGHHKAGLNKMRNMLSSIDYVVECRDYRLPVTSINPAFEEALGATRRLVVYTKRDLGEGPKSPEKGQVTRTIKAFDPNTSAFFVGSSSRQEVSPIIKHLENDAYGPDNLVGCRLMVVGMPNVGKSTLINSLRNKGMKKAKAVQTGGQPGVTKKVGTPVKIIERENGAHVYILDTPGVFVPYVHDAERMLKLALCGCVKDAVISPIMLADYLLYQINLHDTQVYQRWSEPTNEIITLLDSFARHSGILAKGGAPNLEHAAMRFIQRWRAGDMGRFLLDNLEEEEHQRQRQDEMPESAPVSMTQALKAARTRRKNESL